MSDFIIGAEEKYPKELLKGRITIEGNVVSCLMKDMLLLDEVPLDKTQFISEDGRFYFNILSMLRQKGFYTLDEVTILSNLSEDIISRYEELGGWETIEHQIEIINEKNFDTYIDILFRENIFLHMIDDGFNLLKEIDINGKKTVPLKFLRKLTAEEVIDWYESRITTYGDGYSSKVLEEEEINDFSDEFISECEQGLDAGIPFDVADNDINGNSMNCLPFLYRQTLGYMDGTLNMIAGFSSTGKSSLLITIVMAMIHYGRKVLIITNEENVKKFKVKFLVWMLAKYERYYKLTKKKLTLGNMSEEDRKHLNNVRKHWKVNYKNKVKIISIGDADMALTKKKIRENVLRHGYDFVIYDTFKIQEADFSGSRQDLSLVRDSRELHKLAKKYNIPILATMQLAEYMRSSLWISAETLSNSKQVKEILESLFLMRNVFPEEMDPKSKLYFHPFQMKKSETEDKWYEEEYVMDPSKVYKLLFVEKTRSGANSNDTGIAYILQYSGDHSVFREVAQCRPKHGKIG